MPLDPDRVLKPVKKLRKLIDKMSGQPSPGKVHALRTNTRRFEAMFGALALDQYGFKKSVLKDLSRLRKRAGKVRDMDVLLGYASTVHVKGEDECLVQLLEGLGRRRRKRAKSLSAEAKRLRPELRKSLDRTPAELNEFIRHCNAEHIAANAAGTAVKLASDLAAPRRLGRDTLHPYRLKVKELQNVLKLTDGGSNGEFVNELGEVKDAIGEWHDWEELLPIARRMLDHGARCKLLSEIKSIAGRKYDHAVALTEALRKRHLKPARPRRKRSAAAPSKVPTQPVLEATASLAG